MRKILTLVFLVAAMNLYAQKEQRFTPAYFISGELSSADSFNHFLLQTLPGFHFKSIDSSKTETWAFFYANNENNKDILSVSYTRESAGNSDRGTQAKYNLSHIEIKGELATLAKVYNKLFNYNVTPEQLQNDLPIHGPIGYGYNDKVWNKNNYFFTFLKTASGGYVMLFRKTESR